MQNSGVRASGNVAEVPQSGPESPQRAGHHTNEPTVLTKQRGLGEEKKLIAFEENNINLEVTIPK